MRKVVETVLEEIPQRAGQGSRRRSFWPGLGAGRLMILAAALLIMASGGAWAQAERMEGRFDGVAEAQGMSLELTLRGNRLVGTFFDSNGVTAPIDAAVTGTAAEGLLEFPARNVKVRFFPEAVGLRMVAIPLSEAGEPIVEQINALVFLPPGTRVPALPQGYQPPSYKVRVVDPDNFIISYAFWPPEAVAFGYESVETRFRPMIALYPTVLMDILWKLCSSTYKPAVLGEALRGQGVSCDRVVAKVDQLQRSGRFTAWKAAVEAEKSGLIIAMQCARGFVRREDVCKPASRDIADRAVSLATVASVMTRY
ncbi:MAG: hypothetical protein AAFR46_06300 [Pseudomonadota bacterium]